MWFLSDLLEVCGTQETWKGWHCRRHETKKNCTFVAMTIDINAIQFRRVEAIGMKA